MWFTKGAGEATLATATNFRFPKQRSTPGKAKGVLEHDPDNSRSVPLLFNPKILTNEKNCFIDTYIRYEPVFFCMYPTFFS